MTPDNFTVTAHRKITEVSTWLAVFFLLLILAAWLVGIDRFPPFIDETIHIHTAEKIIARESPLEDAVLGRVFTGWWLALFQPHEAGNALWLARVAAVLTFLPALAGLMWMGRKLAGLWGLALFALLFMGSSYHYFYGRLALADPIACSAVILAAVFAYRLSFRYRITDALLVGLMLFIAFGAKISTLPYFGIPIAAALALRPPGGSWRQNGRWFGAAMGAAVGLSGLFVLLLRLRRIDYLTNSFSLALSRRGLVQTEDVYSLSRVFGNIVYSAETLAAYTGTIAFILLVLAVVVLLLRRRLYLPLVLMGPVMVVWLNQEQHVRYHPAAMALLFLCGAIVLAWGIAKTGKAGAVAALGAVGVWIAVQWLPFAYTAAVNPIALQLPYTDRRQYMESDAAGFGFAEVYRLFAEQETVEVVGMLANCNGLRYAAPLALRRQITCPPVRPDGQDREALAAWVDANRRPGVFVVLEDSPYVPEQLPGNLIGVVEGERPTLSIYDLAP